MVKPFIQADNVQGMVMVPYAGMSEWLWKCTKSSHSVMDHMLSESKVLGLSLTCFKCNLDIGTMTVESVPHPLHFSAFIRFHVQIHEINKLFRMSSFEWKKRGDKLGGGFIRDFMIYIHISHPHVTYSGHPLM